MSQNLKEAQELLGDVINEIKEDQKKVNKINKILSKHDIKIRKTMLYLNFYDEQIKNMDQKVFYRLLKSVYEVTGKKHLNPEKYYTKNEIKTLNAYDYMYLNGENKIELPLTIDNVIQIDEENYVTKMHVKFIRDLIVNDLLRYNFETQREAKFIKLGDSVQKVAKVEKASTEQIAKLALEGTLSSTPLTFNALVGTADEGDELEYDSKNFRLIINKGTFIDVLDGFHRISGIIRALDQNPDLDFTFPILIRNYNTSTAQRHIGEINTVNVMSRHHRDALKAARKSDIVVKVLQRESELKGRISQTRDVHYINNELVTYNILAETIDELFNIETKADAMDLSEYLVEFFDFLIGKYKDEFITNVNITRKKSLINTNLMFVGYLVLAKRMKEEKVSITKLPKILDKIDFNRDNEIWEKLGVLSDGKIVSKTRKNIKDYFHTIEIK